MHIAMLLVVVSILVGCDKSSASTTTDSLAIDSVATSAAIKPVPQWVSIWPMLPSGTTFDAMPLFDPEAPRVQPNELKLLLGRTTTQSLPELALVLGRIPFGEEPDQLHILVFAVAKPVPEGLEVADLEVFVALWNTATGSFDRLQLPNIQMVVGGTTRALTIDWVPGPMANMTVTSTERDDERRTKHVTEYGLQPNGEWSATNVH
jgi:hypothetical protein